MCIQQGICELPCCVLTELTTNDRVEKNGDTAFCTGFVHKFTQVIIKCAARFGIKFRVFLFLVIMSELDKHIVTRFNQSDYSRPSFFVDKTLGTTSTGSMVGNNHFIGRKKAAQHHPPSTFLVLRIFEVTVRHS